VDQYVATLELEGTVLERLGLSRQEVVEAFIEHDIARHGLATLAGGNRARARRILDFGRAVYPEVVRRNSKAWLLAALLRLGPLGRAAARRAYQSYRSRTEIAADGMLH
jgi:hypothetical protein